MQELLAEVSSLEESKKYEKEAHDKLKEQHSALAELFEEEKVTWRRRYSFTSLCN